MLLLSQKVKVLKRKEKKSCVEVVKICGKNEYSIHKIVKTEKEIHTSFAAPL